MGLFHRHSYEEVERHYVAPHSPPHVRGTAVGYVERVADEARLGVTIQTIRCTECGKRAQNRWLGKVEK